MNVVRHYDEMNDFTPVVPTVNANNQINYLIANIRQFETGKPVPYNDALKNLYLHLAQMVTNYAPSLE